MYEENNYSNSDKEFMAIKDFLTQLENYPLHDNNWDPSRFDWWRYSYHHDKGLDFFEKNAHYWTKDEVIIALAISEYGKEDIFIIVHPDHQSLYDDVLAWCINDFGHNKALIKSSIFMTDSHKIERLESKGFIKDRHENNVRTYDLMRFNCSYKLPEGFELQTFSDYLDYDSKCELICSAFSKESHSVERIKSFMQTPGYDPDMDMIISKDGKAAAYCAGWLEQHDPNKGYIEPMGTHASYRRLGLGTCLVKETFKRLREKGVKFATIASNAEPDPSNHFYESLNPMSKKSGYEYVYTIKASD
jgi:ribosomal protein S18 acetylase RimI-like enzyme